jgi:hypothetical protein
MRGGEVKAAKLRKWAWIAYDLAGIVVYGLRDDIKAAWAAARALPKV